MVNPNATYEVRDGKLLVNHEPIPLRKGIVYVISRMDWYWKLSSLLLTENRVDAGSSVALRNELEKRIVDLYKALLSYQVKSVCSYYRKQYLVFFHDMVMLDDMGWQPEECPGR